MSLSDKSSPSISQDVFSKPHKKRGEPYIFEKGLFKKIYNNSNSQEPQTVTVVCQMKNCNKIFENQKTKHSTSNYLQHYRRSHKSMNIDLLLREQIEDPFNFQALYQSGTTNDQFESQRSLECPQQSNKYSTTFPHNPVQSEIIYIRNDINSDLSSTVPEPPEETIFHLSSTPNSQHPLITSQSQCYNRLENEEFKLTLLEKSKPLNGKRKEKSNLAPTTSPFGKIRKLKHDSENLSFKTSEDALLAARDLIIHAYGLTTERTEQERILDLLQIFRQYTEKGYLNNLTSIIAKKAGNLGNATTKADTRDRDTNQSSVPKSTNSPETDKDLCFTIAQPYGLPTNSDSQELTVVEKTNVFS